MSATFATRLTLAARLVQRAAGRYAVCGGPLRGTRLVAGRVAAPRRGHVVRRGLGAASGGRGYAAAPKPRRGHDVVPLRGTSITYPSRKLFYERELLNTARRYRALRMKQPPPRALPRPPPRPPPLAPPSPPPICANVRCIIS
eukprot:scaffold53036_cov63-Phaeocystis_antarctica.AAC.1